MISNKFFRGFLALTLALAISACSEEEVREDSEDAFITPTGEAAAPIEQPKQDEPSAGDPGLPAPEFKTIYFPFDSSVLVPQALSSLKENATYMRDNPTITIQIEGHCDERGTVEYNLALGERRAAAALNQLRKLGIEANRLSIISYGKERPADPGHDESAWAQNRRAAFTVTAQ